MSLKHSACHAFRALPLPDGAFLHSSAAGAFRGHFVWRFLRFWCVLGGPAGAFLVQIVVKKVFRKKNAKLSENGSRCELGAGPAESLKQKNWQLQIWEELRNKRGGPHTLLVPEARWRILYYISLCILYYVTLYHYIIIFYYILLYYHILLQYIILY